MYSNNSHNELCCKQIKCNELHNYTSGCSHNLNYLFLALSKNTKKFLKHDIALLVLFASYMKHASLCSTLNTIIFDIFLHLSERVRAYLNNVSVCRIYVIIRLGLFLNKYNYYIVYNVFLLITVTILFHRAFLIGMHRQIKVLTNSFWMDTTATMS